MNKYLKRVKGERPLSTLTEEEYNMLKEMGLLYELYPDALDEYVDISMEEFRQGKLKRQRK
jgi:hypothetical protein